MPLDEKRKILSKHRCCFLCLKQRHKSKKCRVRLRCMCSGRHTELMCPNLEVNKNNIFTAPNIKALSSDKTENIHD